MTSVAALIAEFEAFCLEFGIAETTFGRKAVNDGKFMLRLRSSGKAGFVTVGRAREFMDAERARRAAANDAGDESGHGADKAPDSRVATGGQP